MDKDDIVLAFFPCIRFENQIMFWFRGQSASQKKWTDEQKVLYDMNLLDELHENYDLVCQLYLLCKSRGLRLILENPFSEEHFLRRYWCILPAVIDKDRTERGDYMTKPTQYWFFNCKPENNIIFEPMRINHVGAFQKMNAKDDFKTMGCDKLKTARSMMHPDYANRFIREFILDEQI